MKLFEEFKEYETMWDIKPKSFSTKKSTRRLKESTGSCIVCHQPVAKDDYINTLFGCVHDDCHDDFMGTPEWYADIYYDIANGDEDIMSEADELWSDPDDLYALEQSWKLCRADGKIPLTDAECDTIEKLYNSTLASAGYADDHSELLPEAYAIFEHSDRDTWSLCWLGTDEQDAWNKWEEQQEEADKYRGPDYPIYLIKYSGEDGFDEDDRRLTKEEFNELANTNDPDIIENYRNYGHELDSYEADYNYRED